MINKEILRNVIADCREDVMNATIVPRDFVFQEEFNYVLTGVRRAGKSYLLYQRIRQLLGSGYGWEDILYINFEDERIAGVMSAADLNLLLEIHQERYGKRPVLFLDELQDILGWETFARRLADSKYRVYITGSNAKALSSEISTTLGGRYIEKMVYPYSFKEYLDAEGISIRCDSLDSTASRATISGSLQKYFLYGGLPEVRTVTAKKEYLTSIYQKIYLGDICARHKIDNPAALRILIKKLSETVTKPVSYNRLKNILSGIGIKIGTQTVINYLDYAKDACLLRPLDNWSARFVEKESNKKYYYIDNGILKLFYTENNGAMLENLVALSLFRKYGWDEENPKIWYDLADNKEVDFYIPEDGLAIQVCWTLSDGRDFDTVRRERDSLLAAARRLKCKRCVIVTFEESGEIEESSMKIEIVPLLKWLIEMEA